MAVEISISKDVARRKEDDFTHYIET